jgi:hypothetical protein
MTNTPPHPSDDVARRADESYHRIVRPQLASTDESLYLAIDVDTDDHELDADDYSAVMRLRTRRPAGELFLMRADGSPYARMRAVR